MPRYLNQSELAYVRWAATESLRWRRPRKASRVRTYSLPRRPRSDLDVLLAVLAGLRRLAVS